MFYKYSANSFAKIIPSNAKSLEIGPFQNPMLIGDNVKYFDIYTTEEIVSSLAIKHNRDASRTPNIDYVSPEADLSIIDEKFEIVFSSHVIEHQPDLITHLHHIDRLLTQHGKYYTVIPDKRYCFDHYLTQSTIPEVIAAYYQKAVRHSFLNQLKASCFTTHSNPRKHFLGLHKPLEQKLTPQNIEHSYSNYCTSQGYVDCHAWFFTPRSFKKIINQLNKLGYISFKVEKIYPTFPGKLEFYAILSK